MQHAGLEKGLCGGCKSKLKRCRSRSDESQFGQAGLSAGDQLNTSVEPNLLVRAGGNHREPNELFSRIHSLSLSSLLGKSLNKGIKSLFLYSLGNCQNAGIRRERGW